MRSSFLAAAVGAAGVALAVLADQAQLAFAFLLSKSRYAALVVPRM